MDTRPVRRARDRRVSSTPAPLAHSSTRRCTEPGRIVPHTGQEGTSPSSPLSHQCWQAGCTVSPANGQRCAPGSALNGFWAEVADKPERKGLTARCGARARTPARATSSGSRRVSTGKVGGGLTSHQAAALLGVHVQTIHRWVRAGRIRAERITPPMGQAYFVLNKEDVEQVRRERGPQARG